MSTASSGEALQSLGTALRSALARVRSTDDLYDVTCGVLRHHLGPEILLSVYEEDAGRVWLRAQRGYAETTNSYPLGDGLISEALRDERSIGIVTGAASNSRSGPLGVGVETLVVSPFASGRIRGAIVFASRETLDPPIREAADDVARVVEQALAALPASELERPTGSRWLSRSFLRLASTRDRHALFELTARLVGEVLDVDCVQAAEGNDELVVVATCHAGRERLYPLSDAAVNSLVAGSGGEPFRLGAESWNGELSSGASLEGRCEVIGLPMRAGNELLGFLVASSRTLVEIQAEAFEQAELLVAHASTALSTLRMLERSERAAVTDGLTGLWNHRRFHETSLALIEAAPEVEFALVLADLDDFKELNDRRGHVAGDDALRAVAGVLRRGMRPGDSVFRLGGEEFALLLPSTSRPNARTVCRRLQRTLETLDLGWLAAHPELRRRALPRRRLRSPHADAGGRRRAVRGEAARQGPDHDGERAPRGTPLADDEGAHPARVRADAPARGARRAPRLGSYATLGHARAARRPARGGPRRGRRRLVGRGGRADGPCARRARSATR